jgi:hypothetical protein
MNFVCTRLLDVSDCAESPLLAESKHRRRWGRRGWTDSYLVPYADLRRRGQPRIDGLTETYYKGQAVSPEYITQMERLLEQFSADETV